MNQKKKNEELKQKLSELEEIEKLLDASQLKENDLSEKLINLDTDYHDLETQLKDEIETLQQALKEECKIKEEKISSLNDKISKLKEEIKLK